MPVARFALCSERAQKPVTREVFDDRADAERGLDKLRRREGDAETTYWIAELGSECEGWRHLGSATPSGDS